MSRFANWMCDRAHAHSLHTRQQFSQFRFRHDHKTAKLWYKPFIHLLTHMRSDNFFSFHSFDCLLSGLCLIWFKIKNSTLHSGRSSYIIFFFRGLFFCHKRIFKIWFLFCLLQFCPMFFWGACINSVLIVRYNVVLNWGQNLRSGAHCRRINRQSCFMLIIKNGSNKVAKVDNKFYNFFYLKSYCCLLRVEKYFEMLKIIYIEYSKSEEKTEKKKIEKNNTKKYTHTHKCRVHRNKVDLFFTTNWFSILRIFFLLCSFWKVAIEKFSETNSQLLLKLGAKKTQNNKNLETKCTNNKLNKLHLSSGK